MSTATHSITAPASVAFPVTNTIPIPGIVINDPTAAAAPGSVALDLACTSGELNVPTYTSARSLTLTGPLAQVNAAVAKLSYTATLPFAGDAITTQMWPQSGVPYSGPTIPITVAGPVAPAPTPTIPAVQTRRARDFSATLCMNTHLPFGASNATPQYADLAAVATAVAYIWGKSGVAPLLRDSPNAPTDPALFASFASLCKPIPPKVVGYIGQTSQAGMQTAMTLLAQMAKDGILYALEGGDEEDDAYPQSLGNTLAATAAVQRELWTLGQSLNLPVINMSFGAGWTEANDWHGNYDKVGNLAPYCDFANAHTYPNGTDSPTAQLTLITADALIPAPGRPVMQTEFGYPTSVGLDVQAKQTLTGWCIAFAMGCPLFGVYALCDDMSGGCGVFNADWSPRPLATALGNLLAILGDNGADAATFTPGTLAYEMPGCTTIPLALSDGGFAILAYVEAVITTGENPVTECALTLPAGVTATVSDPMTGGIVPAFAGGKVGVPCYPVAVLIS